MLENDRWITTTEAGRILGVSSTTGYRLAISGQLTARRTSVAGHWRISEESMRKYQTKMTNNSNIERAKQA